MKRYLPKLAGLVVCAGIAGLLFAWSGLYNVAATAGHWPPTEWLLHFAMRNSVETHARGIEAPPDLGDLALIERGAGHYETGCAPCHGAPGAPGNRIPNAMLPEPPYLPAIVSSWSSEELFWIVRHGLKYTGMPAWPAQNREDEVWAVTAFLNKLPGLDAADYAMLAKGAGGQVPAVAPPADPPLPEAPGQLFTMTDATLFGACVRCHGLDGAGRPSGAFPRLDRQNPEYLARALDEYASGVRPSGIMQPIAAALEPAQVERLARHYSDAAGDIPPAAAGDPAVLELGRRIAVEGFPDRQVAPCSACHGLEDGPDNPLFPALNGQYAAYTLPQLLLFQQGKRGGGAYAAIMEPIVRNLSEAEMQAVAHFYASLRARPSDPPAPSPPTPTQPGAP